MTTSVRARYANGVLVPLEPLDLEEGAEVTVSVEEHDSSLSVRPNKAAFASRGFALLRQSEWDRARSDLLSARNMGMDLVSAFRADYADIAAFERAHGVKLPQDIADMVSVEEGPQPAFDADSLTKELESLRKSIPSEVRDSYPTDAARNYKHYLYGHPKEED